MNLNATMLAQAIVLFILTWFTMRFVWPPMIKAIDERREKIKQGLEAAENNQKAFKEAEARIQKEFETVKNESAQRLVNAETQAKKSAEEIRIHAEKEAERIIRDARLQMEAELSKARQQLREELSVLVVKGAEQILRREINKETHSDIIRNLQTEFKQS
jgi:F-type H+-transporting ATPase subunit b